MSRLRVWSCLWLCLRITKQSDMYNTRVKQPLMLSFCFSLHVPCMWSHMMELNIEFYFNSEQNKLILLDSLFSHSCSLWMWVETPHHFSHTLYIMYMVSFILLYNSCVHVLHQFCCISIICFALAGSGCELPHGWSRPIILREYWSFLEW